MKLFKLFAMGKTISPQAVFFSFSKKFFLSVGQSVSIETMQAFGGRAYHIPHFFLGFQCICSFIGNCFFPGALLYLCWSFFFCSGHCGWASSGVPVFSGRGLHLEWLLLPTRYYHPHTHTAIQDTWPPTHKHTKTCSCSWPLFILSFFPICFFFVLFFNLYGISSFRHSSFSFANRPFFWFPLDFLLLCFGLVCLSCSNLFFSYSFCCISQPSCSLFFWPS